MQLLHIRPKKWTVSMNVIRSSICRILSVVLTAIIISTIFAIYYFYFRPKEGLTLYRARVDIPQ
ncbi:ORF1307 [White spot syndrome virus]|uniref:ORF1307 n=1 Tax=White spot syndrome virus TaxID=342409 RepID=A0A2D3I723_9VIRU|nr:ORF1307 [White spot syndrome virus]